MFELAQPFKSFNISGSARTIFRTGVLILKHFIQTTWWCQGRAVHERFRVRQLRERELMASEFCTAGSSVLQLWGPRFPPSLTLEAVSFAGPIKDENCYFVVYDNHRVVQPRVQP